MLVRFDKSLSDVTVGYALYSTHRDVESIAKDYRVWYCRITA